MKNLCHQVDSLGTNSLRPLPHKRGGNTYKMHPLIRPNPYKTTSCPKIELMGFSVTKLIYGIYFTIFQKIPIVSQHRSLVKHEKLVRIHKEAKSFMGKKKESLYLLLFSDLLLITKRKR